MASSKRRTADTIGTAFAETLRERIAAAGAARNQRSGRYQINVLAEITRDAMKLTTDEESLVQTRSGLKKAVAEGRAASETLPRYCVECDEEYRHEPPETTRAMCSFCTAETNMMEGADDDYD